MIMLYVLLICFSAQAVSAANVDISATENVAIVATPEAIHDGFTSSLNVNCSFSPTPGSDFSTVMSLILSKTASPQDDVYDEIATISAASPSVVEVKDSFGSQEISGHFQQHKQGVSFISYSWSYPTSDVQGRYKCQAYGIDQHGHPRVSEAVTEVVEAEVDLKAIMDKMKNMDLALKDQQAKIDDLTSQVNRSWSTVFQARSSYGGHSYFLSKPVVRGVDAAIAMCQNYGGYLMEVNDDAEMKFAQQFVKSQLSADNSHHVFLGATDEGSDRTWTFLSSGTVMPAVHIDGVTENCLALTYGGGLDDRSCESGQWERFLCENNA